VPIVCEKRPVQKSGQGKEPEKSDEYDTPRTEHKKPAPCGGLDEDPVGSDEDDFMPSRASSSKPPGSASSKPLDSKLKRKAAETPSDSEEDFRPRKPRPPKTKHRSGAL
jgi:hypothetical protein